MRRSDLAHGDADYEKNLFDLLQSISGGPHLNPMPRRLRAFLPARIGPP